MEKLCRYCLNKSNFLVNIYDDRRPSKEQLSLAEMLNECCADCKVVPDDPLPKLICVSCVAAAQNAILFKRTSKRSHKFLLELLHKDISDCEDMQPEDVQPSQSSPDVREECPAEPVFADEMQDNIDISCVKIECAMDTSHIQMMLENNALQHAEENLDVSCVKVEPLSYVKMEPLDYVEAVVDAGEDDELRLPDDQMQVEKAAQQTAAYTCEICGKRFFEEQYLTKHLSEHQGKTYKFKCNECPKQFMNRVLLRSHMRMHLNQLDFKCPHCPRAYKYTQHLEDHMLIHTDERPFVCPHCHKSFTQRAHRNEHIEEHTANEHITGQDELDKYINESANESANESINNQLQHDCPCCEETFTKKVNFDKHILIHLTHIPQKCPYCPISFDEHTELELHLKTHAGQKIYHCRFCLEVFRTKTILSFHIRYHKSERPFKCPNCQKKFAIKSYCEKHKWSCKKSRTTCLKCHRTFNYARSLAKHRC